MKIRLPLTALALLLVATCTNLFSQTYELQRSVVGSGGSVYLLNSSDNTTLSSELGQTAIFSLYVDGEENILHQGFWVPDMDTVISVDDNRVSVNKSLMNYPNPFTVSTNIKYMLPGNGFVTIKIFDVSGRLKKILVSENQSQGEQSIMWDGKDMNGVDCSAGTYIYELKVTPANSFGTGSFDEFMLRNLMVIVR